MSTARLSHLQKEIQGYYEQLESKETALRLAEVGDKGRIKQQITYQVFTSIIRAMELLGFAAEMVRSHLTPYRRL
jgi:hypothetical protein